MSTNPNALHQRWPTPHGTEQDAPNRLAAQSLQDLNQAIVALKSQLTTTETSLTAATARITALEGRVTALGG